jgi:homoserine/homoserine lactone efflux protein
VVPIEVYLSYVFATVAVLAVPGPTVILIVSYALARGRGAALACVAGVGLGDLTSVTLSLIGLGTVLAASATLFTALKWAGAMYLIWLGIKMWRSPAVPLDAVAPKSGDGRAMVARTWFVTALNPKSIAFYVAFLPHFVAPERPMLPQFVLLGATFVILGVINALLYALFAGGLRRRLRSASAMKAVNRLGGSFLIGAGLLTAAIRRTA